MPAQIFDLESGVMRGSDAIRRIRSHERERRLRPACIILCSGNVRSERPEPGVDSAHDAAWQKPFPDFTDGSMQRQLRALLAARPAAAPDGAAAHATARGGPPAAGEAVRQLERFAAAAGLSAPRRGAWLDMLCEVGGGLRMPLSVSSAEEVYGGGAVLYVNDAFCALTGYARHELEGRSLRLLDGKRTEPEAKRTIHSALAIGQPATVVLTSYSKDLRAARHMLRVQPVKDSAGRHCYPVAIQIEVQAQPERLAEFERLAQALPSSLGEHAARPELGSNGAASGHNTGRM